MSSISRALESYMEELRNGLHEEILGDNDDGTSLSSMTILQLYDQCKLGIDGTKLGLVEAIKCFPPTPAENKNMSSSNGKKDEQRVGFMYYATNCYGSSITTEGEQLSSSIGATSVIGIEDNYNSFKSPYRRFDFVQATWIDSISGETRMSFARIMAILHLDSGKAPVCRDVCFLYIAWLEEDVVESNSSKFSCCPLPRLKYTFRGPPHTNQLWCDIIGLDRIVQPVDAFHDPDIRPSYEAEGRSITNMKENRFLVIPLSVAKKCHSQYSHIIGRGEMLITKDNLTFRKNGMPVEVRSGVKNYFSQYHAPVRIDDVEVDRAII
jgi:hypothetical protein